MDTLTFQDIGLKPAAAKAAAKRASQDGLTAAEYLRRLVERDVTAAQAFDDVVRPIQQAFERGGQTEAELDAAIGLAEGGR